MSEDPARSATRIPRPASLAPEGDVEVHEDFDTTALLIAVQDELDQAEVPDPTEDGRRRVRFADERPAVEYAREQGGLEAMRQRAAWFEQEAAASEDPSQKAGLLLLASEHYAALGEPQKARALATLAAQSGNEFAARQERQLAYEEGDIEAVRRALAHEAESAESANARAHAAFYLAEIERLKLDSATQAVHYLDIGQRHVEGDPRAPLFKLARQLGQSARAPSVKWPDTKEVEPLRFATSVIAGLRSDRARSSERDRNEPLVAFVEAQHALLRGKAVDAGRALSGLFLEPELGAGARWLSAALLGPDPETRSEAVASLGELLDLAPSATLRRALAVRSLEAGDTAAAEKALFEDDGDDPAFDDIERLSLGALLSASHERLSPWLERAAASDTTRPFAWAISKALGGSPTFAGSRSAATNATLRVADLLHHFDTERVAPALEELRAVHPEDALLEVLSLEVAHAQGRTRALAETLVTHPRSAQPESQLLAHYAAGLLLERAGDAAGAKTHYRTALASEGLGEAALRALQTLAPGDVSASDLCAVAERLPRGAQRETLFIEAALRLLGPTDVDGQSAATAALRGLLEAHPDSSVGALLEERRLALGRDRAGLSTQLRQRLLQASSAFERAFLAVRLWGLERESPDALGWIERALEVVPNDAALVSAYEQSHRPDAVKVAKLRERLAAVARSPWSKARLLLEAALHYELGGAHSEAARAARESDGLASTELARQCYVRNALLCEEAVVVKEAWVQEAEAAPDAARLLGLLVRLFDLERVRNQPESERQWLEEARSIAPERVDLAVELEQLLLRQKKSRELLPVEAQLCDLLPPGDRVPHALLAARRERIQKGWSSAYASLGKADAGPAASLYLLRQLQAHARRGGDDAATLALSLRLIERVSYDQDKVILYLRAAEAALRLNQKEQAEALVSDALRLAPAQVLLHHFRAATLRADDPVHAAIACESLAKGSRVAKHQAEAWYSAAELWFDCVHDEERAVLALQRAADADPTNPAVFSRLLRSLQRKGDREATIRLLDQRIEVVADIRERGELLLLQAQVHADAGDDAAARRVLERLVNERQDWLLPWQRLSVLLERAEDAAASEQAWLQIARLSSDREEQAAAYLALGKLYQHRLDNLERAERCYQEVLLRNPQQPEARAALLPLYLGRGQLDLAKKHLTETLAGLPDEATRQRSFLDYILLSERLVDDRTHQGELLDQALDLWPLEPEVLTVAARYYARVDPSALAALRDGTFAEVSRKLLAGFLEPRYLEATAALCEIEGNKGRARLLQAMAAALSGRLLRLPPLLGQSMQRTLDEHLAPAPMVSPLRTLLMLTRGVLEHAFASTDFDASAERADSPVTKRVRTIAAQAGVPAPVVCIDSAFPYGCWLNGGKETQLVFGERLHKDASNEELDFLIWRNLKLVQARAAVFTRLDPAQTKIAVVAFLSCFVDVNLATDWDQAEFEEVKARISPLVPSDLDDDVPVLALDALRSITKSGEHLALAARKWANRTALLATGNINAALSALTRLTGQTLATDPALRLRQLADNPETRDLVSAALLPAMAEARPKD